MIQFFFFFYFSDNSVDAILETSQKLMERLHYTWEMIPLLYVISKLSKCNEDEAYKSILDGNYIYFKLIF